jgi:hypothetical protein
VSEYTETTVIDVEEPAKRNPALVALAALVALFVGAVLWLFIVSPLLSGDDPNAAEAELAAVQVAAAPGETATAAALTATVDDETLPLVTYEVFLDRDPFDPVVPEPVAEAAATETATAEGGVGDTTDGSGGTTDLTGGTTDGTTPPPTDAGDGATVPVQPPPTGGCTTGEDGYVCDGRVVSLLDIRTDEDGQPVAIVQVGSTVYEARVGETFAGTFRVQSISGDQVFLLYGDDGFDLREGDRVLK